MLKYLPTVCVVVISIYSTKKSPKHNRKIKTLYSAIWNNMKIKVPVDKFNNRDLILLNKNDKTLQTVVVLV